MSLHPGLSYSSLLSAATNQGKALGGTNTLSSSTSSSIIMDSLEERVSVFYYENSMNLIITPRIMNSMLTPAIQKPNNRGLYWESQQALLQEMLDRSASTGSKLRQEAYEITEKVRSKQGDLCRCHQPNVEACNNCLRHGIINFHCDKGFKASLRIAKWSETKKNPRDKKLIKFTKSYLQNPLPNSIASSVVSSILSLNRNLKNLFVSGSHEYIEVLGNTPTSRAKQLVYVVEFRDQYEIAKACKEYRNLVRMLPTTYVGKPDSLKAIVRVVCDAAKRSMKESRMHMDPWRRESFIIMKWSASIERVSSTSLPNRYDVQSSSLSSEGARASSAYRYFAAAPVVVVT